MADNQPIPTNPRFHDLSGKTFGRWLVISYAGKTDKQPYWTCLCACGTERRVAGISLKRGLSTSCGCYHDEIRGAMKTTHGCAKRNGRTRTYQAWLNLRSRCTYELNNRYQQYGERGITVCERWLVFENFLADMGPSPSAKHTVDRKDNNGNYEPDNCRWATNLEQSRNRRTNRLVTHNGQTLCLQDWANAAGINRRTLAYRLSNGWPMEMALQKPAS